MLIEYEPTDEFIAKMQKISLADFECDWCDYGWEKKKIRNCYDSRMRKKNLMVFYMSHLIENKSEKSEKKEVRTIGTQTEVHSMKLKSGGFSIIRSKNLTS